MPAASALVVADVRCERFSSIVSSANRSVDAHVGVARVGVDPQDSAVSLVSDVSVGVRAGPVSSQAAQVVSLVTSTSAAACAIASVVGSTVPCVSTAASEGSVVSSSAPAAIASLRTLGELGLTSAAFASAYKVSSTAPARRLSRDQRFPCMARTRDEFALLAPVQA